MTIPYSWGLKSLSLSQDSRHFHGPLVDFLSTYLLVWISVGSLMLASCCDCFRVESAICWGMHQPCLTETGNLRCPSSQGWFHLSWLALLRFWCYSVDPFPFLLIQDFLKNNTAVNMCCDDHLLLSNLIIKSKLGIIFLHLGIFSKG